MKNDHSRFISLLLACLAMAAGNAAADSTTLSEGWRFQSGATPGAAEADGGTAKLPWKGQAWYRRSFSLPENAGAQRVYFDFDGVMAFPKVYINGQLAGEWDYGYNSFRVDATPFVKWGGENVIAVHVDTRRWGSRWYPGAGIYRKVVMTVLDGVRV
jgi:beta-galactosidase